MAAHVDYFVSRNVAKEDKCAVHSQTMITDGLYLGMYEVKFTNSATNEKVTCDFPRQEPTQVVNGCR